MKSTLLTISIAILTAFSTSAFADVKVRSKQTVSGQSYETATFIKGKRQRSESLGGNVSIMQCDLRRNLQINTNSRTYMTTPFATTIQSATKPAASSTEKDGVIQTGGTVTTTITTRDTGERKQMFGYTARRLITTIESVSSPYACSKTDTKMQTDGWYVDAAFALDCDASAGSFGGGYGQKSGCTDKFSVKTVGTVKRGFAVYEKTAFLDAAGNETFSMINEVIEFSNETLDSALFEVPAGFREVDDPSKMFGMAASPELQRSPASNPIQNKTSSASNPAAKVERAIGPKKPGVVRIGVPSVKAGQVGEGISAVDLAASVRRALLRTANAPSVEFIELRGNLSTDIEAEAHSMECDLVAEVTVSHKKGGGFGMFKSLASAITEPITGAYSASPSAGTGPDLSGRMKNKDELTLGLRLIRTGQGLLHERSIKAKARSDGDDIIGEAAALMNRVIVTAAQGL